MATDGRFVCTEPIPGPLPNVLLNGVAARAYVARANALRELRRHPGWQIGEEQRQQRARAARGAVQRARTDDALEEAQSEIEALRALDDILAEYEAMEEGAAPVVDEAEAPVDQDAFTETEAAVAATRGRNVRAMLAEMGWHVFVRDVAALIRAHAWLLTQCAVTERRTLQARIDALKGVLTDFQQVVNLGLEAEKWQQAQVEEALGKERE